MAHDYELSIAKNYVWNYTLLSGKPIRWNRPYKKVILVNADDCKGRITVSHVRARLQGMGWSEWENLLANLLVQDVVDAINNMKKEADITDLFTCDLIGEDRYGFFCKAQNQVIDFLMGRLFECIEEKPHVMRVRIIDKSISE